MRPSHRFAFPLLLTLVLSAVAAAAAPPIPDAGSASQDEAGGAPAGNGGTPTGPVTAADAEAFFDSLFEGWMTESHVPGAVVSLVIGDEVRVQQGWGHADVGGQRPMDPEDTVFRFGAGIQVTVPLALFQLRAAGALDFETDVDRYLERIRLGDHGGPVTLHHLLVHTAGLDEIFMNVTSADLASRPSMVEQLIRQMPARFMAPGDLRTHSPHGYAIAAHVVEAVSHEPYDEYVKDKIFAPLGMRDTDFRMAEAIASRLAVGYVFGSPEAIPMPVVYSIIEPELQTTAADMGRFLRALLSGGQLDGPRVASREDVDRMLEAQFRHHPRLPGPTYGLFERPINGKVLITNSGARSGHTCQLIVDPADGWGLFFCANAMNYMLVEDFDRRFMDHFYPELSRSEPEEVEVSRSLGDAYLGHFRHTRFPHSTLDKMPALLSGFIREVEVIRHPEGGYEIFGDRYVETAPLLMERVAPSGRLIVPTHDGTIGFGRNDRGEIDRMFVGSAALVRIPYWATVSNLNRIVKSFVIGFTTIVVLLPMIHLILRLRGRPLGAAGRLAVWASVVVAALACLLLSGLDYYLEGGPRLLSFRLPAAVDALLVLPLLTCAGTVLMAGIAVAAWRRSSWNLPARLGYSLIVLFTVAFIPFLLYWNLLPGR